MRSFQDTRRTLQSACGVALSAIFILVAGTAPAALAPEEQAEDQIRAVYACTSPGSGGNAAAFLTLFWSNECTRSLGNSPLSSRSYCSSKGCASCQKIARELGCNMVD
jgi:hypothetical protein